MPTTVSDTFAFACGTKEAWDIVRTRDPAGNLGLSDDAQLRAFAAARTHVNLSITGILLAGWTALCNRAYRAKTTRYSELTKRAPDSRTLERESDWSRQVVNTRGKELSVGVSIEPDRLGERYALYAYLKAPEAHIDAIYGALDPRPVYLVRAGEYLYVAEQLIEEGRAFVDVAEALSDATWPALEQAHKLLSPVRGTAARK